MTTFGPDFCETHTLGDGVRINLRFIRPDDRDELRRAFARLSPTSRYLRFMSYSAELTAEMLRYLTEVDGSDHVAIVATTESHDMKSENGIGVARFIRLAPDADVAEAAVTVADAYQGRGLGTLLLKVLAGAARERGIRTFRAYLLAANEPMRQILEQMGAVVSPAEDGVLRSDVPLDAAGEPGDADSKEHPLRRLLRAAAASFGALRTGLR